ncbi:unnamed protein product [Staurois parvus]|uniref:Secreted protein n=1 Tax=Staurois parvus TaxID=386267 RepID=A0ABN9B2S1_9NEOB|nr:unnamed protein product [Staurois parvus]
MLCITLSATRWPRSLLHCICGGSQGCHTDLAANMSLSPLYGRMEQGRTDHLETRALPEGPGSVGGPMKCPWYLFHRLF